MERDRLEAVHVLEWSYYSNALVLENSSFTNEQRGRPRRRKKQGYPFDAAFLLCMISQDRLSSEGSQTFSPVSYRGD